jgi:arsenate reductase (glutaredoxin)
MPSKLTIYHNPRCRKSREALQELEAKGLTFDTVEYIKDTPSVASLKQICVQLGLKPEQIVRKGEALYKSDYKNKSLVDAEWLRVLVDHPVLIERPIIVKDQKAIIAREPGVLTKFLK